jgi:hypothetical protein
MIFMKEAASDNSSGSHSTTPFDLSEESSQRPGDDEATSVARQVESDDANEESNTGPVNTPDDSDVEDEVWTSSRGE